MRTSLQQDQQERNGYKVTD